jgi:hypothetical protein
MMRWVVVLVVGCSSPPIERLYGEVHVHAYANGVHPAALFVAQPLPAARASGESIFGQDAPPLGSCVAGLAAGIGDLRAVDAGKVDISGSQQVELRFDDGVRTYLPSAPLPPSLFNGGERLHMSAAGAEAPAFDGQLTAPAPLELLSPLVLDHADDEIRWRPGDATRIALILVASRSDGQWTAISCAAADRDGQITISPSLLAVLPPPPRDLQLQVSRDQIVRVAGARPGDGVVLHAGWQVSLAGNEP